MPENGGGSMYSVIATTKKRTEKKVELTRSCELLRRIVRVPRIFRRRRTADTHANTERGTIGEERERERERERRRAERE
jgi:hypothetical protein